MPPILLAGWGGKRKRIGNFGVHKCPNCNNWRSQGIYELSRQATLYFIPVAKWDKKYYVICPVCEAGLPVVEGKLNELLTACLTIPDDETATAIWKELDSSTIAYLKNAPKVLGEKEISDWYAKVTELTSHMKFRREHINQILLVYARDYLGEKWTADTK